MSWTGIAADSLVASAVLAFPIFWALDTRSAMVIVVTLLVMIARVNAANDAIQPGERAHRTHLLTTER